VKAGHEYPKARGSSLMSLDGGGSPSCRRYLGGHVRGHVRDCLVMHGFYLVVSTIPMALNTHRHPEIPPLAPLPFKSSKAGFEHSNYTTDSLSFHDLILNSPFKYLRNRETPYTDCTTASSACLSWRAVHRFCLPVNSVHRMIRVQKMKSKSKHAVIV